MAFPVNPMFVFGMFSLSRKNMRFPNGRRIFMALCFFPFFYLLLIVNQLFMAMDHVFYPGFKMQTVRNAAFIISLPRNATTYLHHAMAEQRDKITTFKLWEILFAPSVIQKKISLKIFSFDRLLGHPIKNLILKAEENSMRKFSAVHHFSLTLPEEDEGLLLWNLSSIFYGILYPDAHYFDDHIAFDSLVNSKKKKDIMHFYFRCIQRHNYVFNQNDHKTFLSKNPSMMPRAEALHTYFPNAFIININRSLDESIPSSIALMEILYSHFTSRRITPAVKTRTKNMLVNWCKMANVNIQKYYAQSSAIIDFRNLIAHEPETLSQICEPLSLPLDVFSRANSIASKHKGNGEKNYKKLTNHELEQMLAEVPFMRAYSATNADNLVQNQQTSNSSNISLL